jgi:hypothetical protein
MIIHDMEQLSDEWFAAKSGLPSASKASQILTPTGKLSTQSEAYMNQLLAERAGFGDPPMEQTEWMARGIKLEPQARDLFELEQDLKVRQVGFITNDEGTAGCSPDGLIGGILGFEVKCPKASTHIGYLRKGGLPAYYAPQVHYSMAVTELDTWYFMSYYPGLDPLIYMVHWTDYTDKVLEAVNQFTDKLAEEAARLGL